VTRDVLLKNEVWERIQKLVTFKDISKSFLIKIYSLSLHYKGRHEKGAGTPFPPECTLERNSAMTYCNNKGYSVRPKLSTKLTCRGPQNGHGGSYLALGPQFGIFV